MVSHLRAWLRRLFRRRPSRGLKFDISSEGAEAVIAKLRELGAEAKAADQAAAAIDRWVAEEAERRRKLDEFSAEIGRFIRREWRASRPQ